MYADTTLITFSCLNTNFLLEIQNHYQNILLLQCHIQIYDLFLFQEIQINHDNYKIHIYCTKDFLSTRKYIANKLL